MTIAGRAENTSKGKGRWRPCPLSQNLHRQEPLAVRADANLLKVRAGLIDEMQNELRTLATP